MFNKIKSPITNVLERNLAAVLFVSFGEKSEVVRIAPEKLISMLLFWLHGRESEEALTDERERRKFQGKEES